MKGSGVRIPSAPRIKITRVDPRVIFMRWVCMVGIREEGRDSDPTGPLSSTNKKPPSGGFLFVSLRTILGPPLATGDLLSDAVGAAASVGEQSAGHTDDFAVGVDLGETCQGGFVRPWIANGHNNSTGW